MGTRRSLIIGVAAVVAAMAVFGGLALLAGSGQVDVRLGDDVFEAGRVDRLAANVARDGPILIADASPDRRRDLYLQHLGATDDQGWLAFSAQAPGAERTCLLQWQAGAEQFVDPCTGGRYPADGAGLTRYPTTVDDGVLSVDLRSPQTPSTTTTTAA